MIATVKVFALVYPTEVQEKVKTAVMNLIPVKLLLQDFGMPGLYGKGNLESLRKLHQLLREHLILDTARQVFMNGIEGNSIHFKVNKQVAYMGKVNFPAGEESLGSIRVEISAENEEALIKIIDWLSPRTVGGKPVEEIEL
ncbi:RNA binding protein [uncultured archaeon]|nr:RNA binding protein [uncultured archaeon]